MTMAKGLSSAYQPISAIAMSEPIYAGLVRGSDLAGHAFGHGATYAGHPVAAAVALKVLEIFEKRRLLEHVQRVAKHFAAKLDRYRQHPLVGEVRRIGLMAAIELVADRASRAGFDQTGQVSARLKQRCEAHGLIVRTVQARDSVAFSPPLVISEAEIDEVFERFDTALEETTRWVEDSGLATFR